MLWFGWPKGSQVSNSGYHFLSPSQTVSVSSFQWGTKKFSFPSSFPPGTSSNIVILKFLYFSFNLLLKVLLHFRKTLRSCLVPVLIYCTWTKIILDKNQFFRSNLCKIEVMIIALIEMLELPNLYIHIYKIIRVTWENFVGGVHGEKLWRKFYFKISLF